jgi:hypothetical protein
MRQAASGHQKARTQAGFDAMQKELLLLAVGVVLVLGILAVHFGSSFVSSGQSRHGDEGEGSDDGGDHNFHETTF